MTAGQRWITPTGHPGLELPGSTAGQLHLRWCEPGWPFPRTQFVPRSLCVRDTTRQAAAVPDEEPPLLRHDKRQLLLDMGPAPF